VPGSGARVGSSVGIAVTGASAMGASFFCVSACNL
jgi:hypothetical protein